MDGDDEVTVHPHQQTTHQSNEHGVQILYSKVHSMEKKLDELKVTMQQSLRQTQAELTTEMRKVNRNIQRIALVPAQQVQQGTNQPQEPTDNEQQQQMAYAISLSNNPKDLYQLWHKYEFGMDGQKPAIDFLSTERGGVKFKYYCRKVFWGVVLALV